MKIDISIREKIIEEIGNKIKKHNKEKNGEFFKYNEDILHAIIDKFYTVNAVLLCR